MKLDDLYVKERLVNIVNCETVGYIFEGTPIDKSEINFNCIALSLGGLESLHYEDLDCLQYFDVVTSNVVLFKNSFVHENFVENIDSPMQELKDVDYEYLGGDRVAVRGYSFSKRHLIPFDDETALNRALHG